MKACGAYRGCGRTSRARHGALDEQRPVRVLPSLAQDLPDPRGGRSGGGRVVSADDASARRERDGLNDAGRADLGGEPSEAREGLALPGGEREEEVARGRLGKAPGKVREAAPVAG